MIAMSAARLTWLFLALQAGATNARVLAEGRGLLCFSSKALLIWAPIGKYRIGHPLHGWGPLQHLPSDLQITEGVMAQRGALLSGETARGGTIVVCLDDGGRVIDTWKPQAADFRTVNAFNGRTYAVDREGQVWTLRVGGRLEQVGRISPGGQLLATEPGLVYWMKPSLTKQDPRVGFIIKAGASGWRKESSQYEQCRPIVQGQFLIGAHYDRHWNKADRKTLMTVRSLHTGEELHSRITEEVTFLQPGHDKVFLIVRSNRVEAYSTATLHSLGRVERPRRVLALAHADRWYCLEEGGQVSSFELAILIKAKGREPKHRGLSPP